ncbi:hypothetical protein HDU83_009820 [Entophlyctis luteolus]|nr:hypothetical protein HDU83_009820 [Entophlyctis luteolus]
MGDFNSSAVSLFTPLRCAAIWALYWQTVRVAPSLTSDETRKCKSLANGRASQIAAEDGADASLVRNTTGVKKGLRRSFRGTSGCRSAAFCSAEIEGTTDPERRHLEK